MRTVVYGHKFESAMQDIQPNYYRADEFLRGIEWLLTAWPECGDPIRPNSPVWILATDASLGVPAASIYYTFNDTEVCLKFIRPLKTSRDL